MTTALILAAETAEKSKTAFYVAGGALAVWALILSAIGITRHDFPSTSGKAAVMAISAILVVGAMSTAVITAG